MVPVVSNDIVMSHIEKESCENEQSYVIISTTFVYLLTSNTGSIETSNTLRIMELCFDVIW